MNTVETEFYKLLEPICPNKDKMYFEYYLLEANDRLEGMEEKERENLDNKFRTETKKILTKDKHPLKEYSENFIMFLKDRYESEVKSGLFSKCNHFEKKGGVCLNCGYKLCYGEKKYIHPDQFKNCNHPLKLEHNHELICYHCGPWFNHEFSNCDHRRKKRFMDYSDFYCCADCGYHFVDGDPKKRNPKQYLDCDHLHKEIVDDRLVCLRCGYEGEKEENRYGIPPSNKCVHKRFFVLIVGLKVQLRTHPFGIGKR